MLIDATHKKWAVATLLLGLLTLGVYLYLRGTTPGELTGGSQVGLWYGVVGSGLMVYAGLLSALRRVPSWWWLGQRRTWLRGHIWLGLLSAVFILCHSGFRWGGPLELALWMVLLAILVSGMLGLLLQQVLPRLLTTRVPREAPYEQIPHICEVMLREADLLISQVLADAKVAAGVKQQLEPLYNEEVRPFLAAAPPRDRKPTNALQIEAVFARVRVLPGFDVIAEPHRQLEASCEQRRQLAEQERLHRWLHGWLLVHVPLSIALLILGVAHAVMSLYY